MAAAANEADIIAISGNVTPPSPMGRTQENALALVAFLV
jgi:hypothetical protein